VIAAIDEVLDEPLSSDAVLAGRSGRRGSHVCQRESGAGVADRPRAGGVVSEAN
jgi:hypothetical protein